MPISYRSILSVPSSSTLIADVDKVVASWLESKQITVPLLPGTTIHDNQEISRIDWSNEVVASRRWQLREHWDEPIWFTGDRQPERIAVTSITVIQGRDQARIWVDIDAPVLRYTNRLGEEVTEVQESGTPRVIRALIADLETNDGAAHPFAAPLVVRTVKHVQELVTILADDQRIGSSLVSSPPLGIESAQWVTVVADLTRGLDGMATSYVIDPEQLKEFNTAAGAALSIGPGSLRTFQPGVKLGIPADAFRHRVLSARKIRETPLKKIARMLRNAEVKRLADLRLPLILRDVDYGLLRSQRYQPLQGIEELREETKTVAEERDIDLALQLNDRLAAELERQKKDALDALEQAIGLMTQLDDLRETIEIMELETSEVAARADESQDTVEVLRRRLIGLTAVAEAYAPLTDDERTIYPESFDDLVDRLEDFDRLSFVGDAETARALDEHPNMTVAVHKAWDALASLQDYAALTSDGSWTGGGIYSYINDGGHSGRCRLLGFRSTESDTVQNNPGMIAQRTVTVPATVHSTGRLMMTTHVALLNGRAGAPRMYVYDNVSSDGRVYVGYLGEHLQTARY
ncbi:hypothetical protein [Paenarthrobacter sp. PH39-S1]|uniref:hypothetical protein n=1 Tax=Paenarthrobacter sp. PH39-S1 TaxID=3046204 RepID=UPI0024BB95AB|nr:hypothetical protein [Paenarthrobacter sp. PH39-S1]MDJ0357675.1 hypothetical protein [Paenarthrobacter sp. PH39-S1]